MSLRLINLILFSTPQVCKIIQEPNPTITKIKACSQHKIWAAISHMPPISSMIINSTLNQFFYNMLTNLSQKLLHDGISLQQLGDTALTGIPFRKTLDSKIIELNTLILLSHKYVQLGLPNHVLLEKETKNPFLKLYSETLNKNLLQIVTIWKSLMNPLEADLKEKVLELVGNLTRKILSIIEKMSTHLSKINRIHQQNMKVPIYLI